MRADFIMVFLSGPDSGACRSIFQARSRTVGEVGAAAPVPGADCGKEGTSTRPFFFKVSVQARALDPRSEREL